MESTIFLLAPDSPILSFPIFACSKLEKDILKEFHEFKYKGPTILISAANAEIFIKDILNLDNGNEINLHDDLPIFNRKQREFKFSKKIMLDNLT